MVLIDCLERILGWLAGWVAWVFDPKLLVSAAVTVVVWAWNLANWFVPGSLISAGTFVTEAGNATKDVVQLMYFIALPFVDPGFLNDCMTLVIGTWELCITIRCVMWLWTFVGPWVQAILMSLSQIIIEFIARTAQALQATIQFLLEAL